MTILHIGAGKCKHEGMINLTEKDMDISKPWPYADESIDAVVSQQVLQQLHWPELVFALQESFRVLKKGGVMRFGTMLVEDNLPKVCLGWNNRNLFCFDLLDRVLKATGYTQVRKAQFQDSIIPELNKADNREVGKGTSYIECIK